MDMKKERQFLEHIFLHFQTLATLVLTNESQGVITKTLQSTPSPFVRKRAGQQPTE
jgi:hypothetical protein